MDTRLVTQMPREALQQLNQVNDYTLQVINILNDQLKLVRLFKQGSLTFGQFQQAFEELQKQCDMVQQ